MVGIRFDREILPVLVETRILEAAQNVPKYFLYASPLFVAQFVRPLGKAFLRCHRKLRTFLQLFPSPDPKAVDIAHEILEDKGSEGNSPGDSGAEADLKSQG
ncbi:hypothetical protein N0V84_012684 [Fusarium piperis]|uniref:Uncharacterized protein n=1 Tax=Fusarium piperis TaxID=1435070 RepID=A0A9W8W243_9HYPO|nr:hypothetical protein N0V84_012684 [Fusarium piperis]